ncbi:enoyl-CoA hydratase-related protein, partial [bacterium]|nr:enoyl-CoA hydratase-related protein [bacterium]
IREVFQEVKGDDDVRGVILTGAGEKAFVAGADIKELAQKGPVEAKQFSYECAKILNGIEHFPKPIIAAVNGYCLGGGCELAMACHIRLASDNARFGQPEVNLGLIPGNGGTQRLPRLVGKGRAIQLILTGEMIDAQEAYRIGLVNKVTTLAELIPTGEAIFKTIFSKAPIAASLGIEAINHGLELTLDEGIQLESNLFGLCFSTEDMKEGTQAFIEKRKAEFKGK